MKISRDELEKRHVARVAEVEAASGPAVALPAEYPSGYQVRLHQHSRGQLLYAHSGVVMVSTSIGRWMVPPSHALWVPPRIRHSVDMLGDVEMLSVYVQPHAEVGLPEALRVVSLDNLTRELIVEANARTGDQRRQDMVLSLLLNSIPRLPVAPLGLPLPSDTRLAALCRDFIKSPDPHLTIEDWAGKLAMSRRTFTRTFREQTGISLSTWRQQACLFTAVPRLASGESITTVALDLGYDSVPAFTTMFARMLGAPPRSYLSAS